jgi:hypothetical protein
LRPFQLSNSLDVSGLTFLITDPIPHAARGYAKLVGETRKYDIEAIAALKLSEKVTRLQNKRACPVQIGAQRENALIYPLRAAVPNPPDTNSRRRKRSNQTPLRAWKVFIIGRLSQSKRKPRDYASTECRFSRFTITRISK